MYTNKLKLWLYSSNNNKTRIKFLKQIWNNKTKNVNVSNMNNAEELNEVRRYIVHM